MRSWALAGLVLALAGCGADTDFRQARHLEGRGEVLGALKAYESFLARAGSDTRLGEALWRSGRLYAEELGRCPEAIPLFERAARLEGREGSGDWPARARRSLLDCPDYFPIKDGAAWTYVDSASGGKNMRLELALSGSSEAATLSGAFYAGKAKVRDYRRSYDKRDWTVWESESGQRIPLLRFPFRAGNAWTAKRGGRDLRFSIEAEGVEVETQAGRFRGCLKLRQQFAGEPAWVYEYFCPGVGRVKTTVGVPGEENPNTELAAYRIP